MSLRIFSFVFACFSALPASAQNSLSVVERSAPLTLRQALARSLEKSPELKTFAWDVRAAEAQILQASLKPNPELEVSVENPTGSARFRNGEEMEQTLQLGQLLELGGKRPARLAGARAERAVAEWEYEVQRVEVLKDTAIAFVGVLAAQRAVALAKEDRILLQEAVAAADERVKAAKAPTVESIRASVAVRSASIEIERAERGLSAARFKLAATWGGKTADFGEARGDLENQPAQPDIETLRSRLARNPRLARWQTVREARATALRSEQAQAVPDVTLFAGPRVTGRWEDLTGVVGFAIPLPFSNRNQGNIAAAQVQLSKTEDEERAAEARAFAELNATHQELLRAGREAVILKSQLLPEAAKAVDELNAGYQAGRGTQLEVLDARRTLIAARQQHLQALTEYHQSLAEIEALTAAPAHVPRILGPGLSAQKTKLSKASK